MPPFEIKGKTVCVTGASSGIGAACARAFAAAGARVALLGRDRGSLEGNAEAIRRSGSEALAIVQDLQDEGGIPETVRAIERRWGTVDVLVNNAGYAVAGLVEDCPTERYRENFQVNFFAPLRLIQCVLSGMKAKRSGQILNVSSGVGWRALPGFSSYCATKFALNGLTESLRLEVAPYGIDVIAVSPGRVASRFHERVQFHGRWKIEIPAVATRDPEEIARFILDASRRRRRTAMVWGPGRIGYHLNYWAPRLVDRLLARKYPTDR